MNRRAWSHHAGSGVDRSAFIRVIRVISVREGRREIRVRQGSRPIRYDTNPRNGFVPVATGGGAADRTCTGISRAVSPSTATTMR